MRRPGLRRNTLRYSYWVRSRSGRREAASPEPITTALGVWIPGSRDAHAPRNDAHKDLLTQ